MMERAEFAPRRDHRTAASVGRRRPWRRRGAGASGLQPDCAVSPRPTCATNGRSTPSSRRPWSMRFSSIFCVCGAWRSTTARISSRSRRNSSGASLSIPPARQNRKKGASAGSAFLWTPELAWLSGDTAESLDLSAALNDLAEFDSAKTRTIELHYFLGCTVDETADILDVSRSTVERNLRFSLAWLGERLRPV